MFIFPFFRKGGILKQLAIQIWIVVVMGVETLQNSCTQTENIIEYPHLMNSDI